MTDNLDVACETLSRHQCLHSASQELKPPGGGGGQGRRGSLNPGQDAKESEVSWVLLIICMLQAGPAKKKSLDTEGGDGGPQVRLGSFDLDKLSLSNSIL